MSDQYEYTHITWRKRNDDGSVSNLSQVIHDKERAADEIKELALTEGVFALRFLHVGECDLTDGEPEATEFHTRIGPPISS